jgi:microcystin-dependent protein
MAIKITDNFQVNIKNPIDNRFVVGSQSIPGGVGSIYPTPFYAYRDDISSNIGFVYPGLRIWDFNDNLPYVWTGVTWSNENVSGASVFDSVNPGFTGYQNYITKFYDSGTVLSKSLLFDDNSHVSLGTIIGGVNPNGTIGVASSLTQGLHVQGRIRTNNGFVGIGTYITDLDASNINRGYLRLQHISTNGANNGDIITYDFITGFPKWISPSGVSSGSANNSVNSTVTDDTSSLTNNYITFVNNTGIVPIKVSLSKLQFNPSTGQLFLGNGSATEPAYSFLSLTNTGIYYDGSINFSRNGIKRVSVTDDGINVYSVQYPQIQFIETTTNKNRLLWVSSNDDLLFRTTTTNATTDKRVWHQDNLFTLKAIGTATNQTVETARNLNISLTNAGTNDLIKGVYTYNVYNTTISPSSQIHWSVLSFGRGDEGSVQLASNWFSSINTTSPGTVYAERDILLRSLRDSGESWSPWVKIWNSGNSGYVPFGAILMWSGLTTQIPSGWRLCDGSAAVTIPAGSVPGQPSITTITIPDLRERFVVGAGDSPSVINYNYNSFNISASFKFTVPNQTNGVNYFISGVFNKVGDTSAISSTNIYRNNSSSNGGRYRNGFSYSIYSLVGTSATDSYFIAFNDTSKNYKIYRGFVPADGTNVASYHNFELPQGSVATLSQNSNGIILRPNFFEANWPVSNGYAVGATGGFNNIFTETSELPSHSHLFPGDDQLANADTLAGWTNRNASNFSYDADSRTSGSGKIYLTSDTGSGLLHENRPPFYALAFIIYTGI